MCPRPAGCPPPHSERSVPLHQVDETAVLRPGSLVVIPSLRPRIERGAMDRPAIGIGRGTTRTPLPSSAQSPPDAAEPLCSQEPVTPFRLMQRALEAGYRTPLGCTKVRRSAEFPRGRSQPAEPRRGTPPRAWKSARSVPPPAPPLLPCNQKGQQE